MFMLMKKYITTYRLKGCYIKIYQLSDKYKFVVSESRTGCIMYYWFSPLDINIHDREFMTRYLNDNIEAINIL